MDNSLTPIEELIREGLGKRFYQVFGLPFLFSNAPDKKSVYAQLLNRNPNLKLPFAFASLQSMQMTEVGYNPRGLLRRGLYGSASHDNVLTFRLRLAPVTTTYKITILTEDLDTAEKLSKRWLMTSLEHSLAFSVTYGVADIDIRVNMDAEVQIPDRTVGVDEPKEYELTTNIHVEGYLSKDLEKAQAATTVVTEGQLGTSEAIEEAMKGNPEGVTQVFRFERPWSNT